MDFLNAREDAALRKELQGVRDSYHHFWDLLAELLQNARDAIQRKKMTTGAIGPFFVHLSIDASTNTIKIEDNGIGISPSKIHEMLAPGGGDKGDATPEEVGEKGVGLTYVVFSGNQFTIESRVSGGVVAGGVVQNAQNWLNGVSGYQRPAFSPFSQPNPRPNETTICATQYPLDSFTKVSVDGVMPTPGDTNIFTLSPCELRLLLRTRTAVGVTKSLFESNIEEEFDFYLTLNQPTGEETEKIPSKILSPHTLVASSTAVSLEDVQRAFVQRADIGARHKYLKGKTVWSTKKVDVDDWQVNVYGVMLPENTAFSTLARDVLKVSSTEEDESNGTALFQSGIYVGTKGMPTGMRIAPKAGGRWPAYYRRCYFFVESPKLKFDLGRKSLHYRHINRLQTAVASMFAEFEPLAQFQSDQRVESGVPQETRAERETRLRKEWSDAEALPDLGEAAIPYQKHPNNQEAAVAAIFHELLGAKILTGYQSLTTGYTSQYDIHARYVQPGMSPIQCVLEFKYKLESLVRDLAEKQKHFQDIHLLVAWDADEVKLKEAGFDLSVATAGQFMFDGVTHVLTVPISGIDDIPVILLRHYLITRQQGKPTS